jgi:hypothetical protein
LRSAATPHPRDSSGRRLGKRTDTSYDAIQAAENPRLSLG